MRVASNRFVFTRKGFTLVEILMVVIVLLIIAGISMSSFRGSYKGFVLKTNVKDLADLMRYAQSRAVTQAKEVRLEFDAEYESYWLTQRDSLDENQQEAGVYKRISGRLGKKRSIPKVLTVESSLAVLRFYPDGIIEKVSVHICKDQVNVQDEEQCYTVSTRQQLGSVHVMQGKIL